ncbi:flavin-containing monooxygenase [Cryptosporangium sp. NPDC051539]|uniref:flavin-containing monooxygenase n=1 Tax=Cryptosporangium sp. NPDC051539 TaxID=3363962 RepID=UPI0037B43F65
MARNSRFFSGATARESPSEPTRRGGTLTAPEALDVLRSRYRSEREKRIRPDGNQQYVKPVGALAGFLDDPFSRPAERDPVTDHTTVTCIGGGFAGLITAAALKDAGVDDVRIVDKAGDVGGTWYWNRYPGAQCDTASMVYMPLLEETGHRPSEKYAHGPELFEHCQRIAKHYGLYENALFNTQVRDLEWDATRAVWIVRTNRGDRFTSRFVTLGVGPLHALKLPGVPGIADFAGRAFHTSRWDYAYTGGDPAGAPLSGLAHRRVAVIGTGATGVQLVPALARDCRELFVVQRTPSSVDVRDNHPIDPDWFAQVARPGWQRRWLENFAASQGIGGPADDLVMDGWTALSRTVNAGMSRIPETERTLEAMLAAYEAADFEVMSRIRDRVDAVVEDPAVAAGLKAWYRQTCKRPCFHDEYLQAFNRPNTHLLETDGKGVERITRTGLVVAGTEYPVDCIVFASGFEVGTEYTKRAGFRVTGRGRAKLARHWADGMRTLHGIHVHGFPNAFLVQQLQGASLLSNVPHNYREAAQAIAQTVGHVLASGAREVEVSAGAEDAWIRLLQTNPLAKLRPRDCTPGYYNNEGHDLEPRSRLNLGHPQGALAFFALLARWRDSGAYEGLEFR